MEINERLIKIRKDAGKTQKEFAEEMGMTRENYKNYEYGNATISDPIIKLICITYGVNPQWLKTGEGAPGIPSKNNDLAKEVRDILKGMPEFQVSVMASLAAMPEEWWSMWKKQLEKEIDILKKGR